MSSGPDPGLIVWCRRNRDDIKWLVIEIEYLRRAAIDLDPTVELIVAHPDFPDDEPIWLMGLRGVRGDLGVRVQRRA